MAECVRFVCWCLRYLHQQRPRTWASLQFSRGKFSPPLFASKVHVGAQNVALAKSGQRCQCSGQGKIWGNRDWRQRTRSKKLSRATVPSGGGTQDTWFVNATVVHPSATNNDTMENRLRRPTGPPFSYICNGVDEIHSTKMYKFEIVGSVFGGLSI